AHSYFFPGRPDHREEAEIIDVLAASTPAALVSLNRGFSFFDAAPAYYFLLRRFVQSRYALAGRYGRFDVLERRASPLAASAAVTPRAPTLVARPGAPARAPAARGDAAGSEARLAALAERPVTES